MAALTGEDVKGARRRPVIGLGCGGGRRGRPGMLDKLEFFLALASERHFGRAAEACGVTQPTLSAGIKQLEETLGVLLVQRGSRFEALTPEGERVLDWARRLVGDARAMREEVRALKHGLTGHLKIAAIPTTLALVAQLTTPYRERHPEVRFTILSRTSIEVLTLLENLEVDAGLSYIDNEPLGRVRTVPLYEESYCLITAANAPLGDRGQVGWGDLAGIPLCLLTPDMQNRRIIDGHLREAGVAISPTLESDSMIALFGHVRTGRWASIMPARLAETLGLAAPIRAIPIIRPRARHKIGLVVADRDPHTPQVEALITEARRLAQGLAAGSPP